MSAVAMVNMIKMDPSVSAGDVWKGSAAALAIKLVAALIGFAMFALSARYMGQAEFGSLAVIFNAISFFAVVALCGQETLIVRSWSEYCGSDRLALARGAFVFGGLVVACVALFTMMGVALAWSSWDPTVSVTLLIAACLFLFAQSIMHFSGQFARVAAGVVIGDAPRDAIWRFFVVVAIAACHIFNLTFGTTEFFFASAGAIAIALIFQGWLVARVVPENVKRAKSAYDIKTWIPRSFKMWLSALLDTSSQYLEVVVIGYFLGPKVAGFYFVITRVTNVFAMISGSISVYATSRISALFYSDAKTDLQAMLRSLATICVMLVAIALLIILFAGQSLLWLFGAAFVSVYPELIVMTLGASIGALAGPAAHLLLLTGHEGTYPRIMASGVVLRFALIAALGPLFGLMGAVIACALSTSVISLALIGACCRLVGFDPSVRTAFAGTRQPISNLERSTP
jgi:O-antigen/teichoic acid export membrane protein